MAQATVLAAGTTAATSTDIVVAAGATVTVGIFTADANGIPGNEGCTILIDTPGNDITHSTLTGSKPLAVLSGPCTARVARGVTATSIGVFTES